MNDLSDYFNQFNKTLNSSDQVRLQKKLPGIIIQGYNDGSTARNLRRGCICFHRKYRVFLKYKTNINKSVKPEFFFTETVFGILYISKSLQLNFFFLSFILIKSLINQRLCAKLKKK